MDGRSANFSVWFMTISEMFENSINNRFLFLQKMGWRPEVAYDLENAAIIIPVGFRTSRRKLLLFYARHGGPRPRGRRRKESGDEQGRRRSPMSSPRPVSVSFGLYTINIEGLIV